LKDSQTQWQNNGANMQKPKPNLNKITALWEEWEQGKAEPGKLMSQLKINGLPEILKELIEQNENTKTTGK